MSHHLPGWRNELAQASKNKRTARPFRIMNRWRVNFRRFGMATRKLQIFFVCRPFQDLFFLVGEKPVALLVDLVEDLVDALLCYVGDLFEWLGAGNFVIELILRGALFFLLIGIKKVVAPIEDLVDPDTTVMASAQLVDKEETGSTAGQVGDIGRPRHRGQCWKNR